MAQLSPDGHMPAICAGSDSLPFQAPACRFLSTTQMARQCVVPHASVRHGKCAAWSVGDLVHGPTAVPSECSRLPAQPYCVLIDVRELERTIAIVPSCALYLALRDAGLLMSSDWLAEGPWGSRGKGERFSCFLLHASQSLSWEVESAQMVGKHFAGCA